MESYKNYDWLYRMYVTNELSQAEIASMCNVNQSTIHHCMKKLKIISRERDYRSGYKSHRWNGGVSKTTQGYIHIYFPEHPRANIRNYVPEQILVVEKHLGKFLQKEIAIHHINETKDDNRLENLYMFPNESEHQRYHRNAKFGKIPKITKSNL